MNALVSLIEQTALGLYILLAVGIVWYFRKWVFAAQDYRATTFELERDLASYQRGSAFMLMVLMIEAFLVVVGVQMVVAPTIREDRAMMTVNTSEQEVVQEDGIFATPTRPAPSGGVPFDPSGVDFGDDTELQIFATPVLTATPVGTILPNAPALAGCETENARLQIPANGMQVDQPIRVAGTAFGDNFSFYKIEIARRGGPFSVVNTFAVPVRELGTLAQFNPTFYDPGAYEFRLMVFNTTDTLIASCMVNITISEPIPTSTPIGGL
ncbi:MAG: hypothetical protein OHK0046_39660 [Anaerolineae bacterium]